MFHCIGVESPLVISIRDFWFITIYFEDWWSVLRKVYQKSLICGLTISFIMIDTIYEIGLKSESKVYMYILIGFGMIIRPEDY